MKKVTAIAPTAKGAQLIYPECQDQRQPWSPKLRDGTTIKCKATAKINYKGVNLCLNHAKARALAEVMNEGACK